MFASARASSPRRDANPSQPDPQPDPDSDSASATRTGGMRKRPRSSNEDPPTVACDQCRLRKVRCDRRQPECSNCRKAGVECNSSNTLRRVNHTKQLRDDFSVVLTRLSDVDHALGTLTELTRQIAARPCPHVTHPHSTCPPSYDATLLPTPRSLDFIHASTLDERRESTELFTLDESLFETAEFDQGGKRLYGYPAPLVLIRSLLRQASDPLLELDKEKGNHDNGEAFVTRALQDPASRAALQQKLDAFPFNSPCRESVAAGDMNPVTTPPRLMVNLFVDGYLRNINTRTPIFNDDELHRAIEAHYSDMQPQGSSAWALIINNIVLLELGLEIQAANASHSNSRGMNDDILPSFLRNCDRAIRNLDAFMAPSLLNIQALMTLTLAARDFYNNATAERVCQAACQVGRAIGLHRSIGHNKSDKGNESLKSLKERARLFRVLYAMDKQRVFMTGQPCDLHMFDSDHQIGPGSDPDFEQAGSPITDALHHMMTIWEEIYLNLYTTRAASAGEPIRSHQVRLVTSSMDTFAQKHAELMSSPPTNGIADINPLQIELAYGYRVSQILILKCEPSNEQSLHRMRELARSSLRLILETCKAPLTTSRLALLASMFRNYPLVAFIELIGSHLASLFRKGEYRSAAKADVSLLRAICDQLHILQHDKLTHIFYARLKLGLTWAIDTLESLGEVLVKSSPQPQGLAAFSPQGRDCRRSTESPRNVTSTPSPVIPDISNACGLHQTLESQGTSNPPPSHHNMDSARSGLAELTNFCPFTPGPDRMDLASKPLLSACQFGTSSSSTSQSQSEHASGSMAGNSNWGDFSMDFFHGVFS
ncbi:hypothetical protein AAE478_009962 [Parahypoxylon ruwenzoriense]